MELTNSFWILENNKKLYYIADKKIGDEFTMIQFLISNAKLSSSKAHKFILKIKENKQKK